MNTDTIINSFTDYLNQQGALKPITITRYLSDLMPFFSFLADTGITDIRQITTDMIKRYKEQLLSTEIHSNGKRSRIRVLKLLFEFLVTSNQLLLNPAEKIENITIQRNSLKDSILTVQEITRLLAQPNTRFKEGFRDYLILKLLLSTGIKTGELSSLNTFDLDMHNKRIYVTGKRTQRTRTVPLPEDLITLLSRYIEEIRYHKNRLNPDERALFLSINGNRLNANDVASLLKKHSVKAGITKKVTGDILRHTFALRLLKKEKKNIEDISKLLGHKVLKSTCIRYGLQKNR